MELRAFLVLPIDGTELADLDLANSPFQIARQSACARGGWEDIIA